MKYKINTESDLLNPEIRKAIIQDIQAPENRRRKAEAFKRYEILKDETDLYVLAMLLKQFDRTTVNEMQYALSNISFARKAIDRLARVYNYGVQRTLDKKKDTTNLNEMAKELEFDRKMKKANRYLKAFKNCMVYPKPVKQMVGGQEKYSINVQVLAPYLYDVVADPEDREKPLCVILSDYHPEQQKLYSFDAAMEGRGLNSSPTLGVVRGDGQEHLIAGDPQDPQVEEGQYIWWSNGYHFTTNEKGELINAGADNEPPGTSNPIQTLPFINLAVDQDGEFWAIGGSDLTDGSIRVNAVVTHVIHIGITQGYGQLVLTGKNIPKSIKVGPNSAITLEYDPNENQPSPTAEFIAANPPLADLMNLVSQYVALLLTTNNLSTSSVGTKLDQPTQFPSGLAMMIDKAESNEDVADQQQIFLDAEPEIWTVIQRWQKLYLDAGVLVDDLAEYPLPENVDELEIRLGHPQPVMSEMEKLQALQLREQLGLNTKAELLMMDNPDLTEKDAVERLAKIMDEKSQEVQAQQDLMKQMGMGPNESGQSPGVGGQDNGNAGPGGGGSPGQDQGKGPGGRRSVSQGASPP